MVRVVLMRVGEQRRSDTALARLESGLPPLWEPAQGIRLWWREVPVLDATPPGGDKQPICEATILDSVWSWPV
jgi:hypothetical protein